VRVESHRQELQATPMLVAKNSCLQNRCVHSIRAVEVHGRLDLRTMMRYTVCILFSAIGTFGIVGLHLRSRGR
jgi:hypothetical protein